MCITNAHYTIVSVDIDIVGVMAAYAAITPIIISPWLKYTPPTPVWKTPVFFPSSAYIYVFSMISQ